MYKRQQLVYSIRQDITVKILDQGVIQDPETKDIVYNLAQQDMIALRVVMRLCLLYTSISGENIVVDVVQADCFFPTAFDSSGRMTGAVFTEQLIRGNRIYTRAESHEYTKGREIIRNKAFCSGSNAALGTEVPLSSIPVSYTHLKLPPQSAITNIT